jgi:hypothetical protein
MYPRVEYEMLEEDLKVILEACKPTPVMFISDGQSIGGSQQDNANSAWNKLGKKMGFDYETVRPIQEKGNRFFSAIPSETEQQRIEREKVEADEARNKRIKVLEEEIDVRDKELKELLK